MECLLALIAGVFVFLAAAYALGYSVMGLIVKPLEDAAERESEYEVEIDIRVVDGEDEGDEEGSGR